MCGTISNYLVLFVVPCHFLRLVSSSGGLVESHGNDDGTTPSIIHSVTVNQTSASETPWPNLDCDFNSMNSCGWKNSKSYVGMDDFDWQLGRGRDGHRRRTGARDDHTGGGGYMYIKSGNYRNRTAILLSDFFKISSPGCFRFFYHMRGRHMGHLKLYESDDLKGQLPLKIISIRENMILPVHHPEADITYTLLWSIYGSQGRFWQEAIVPIKKTNYGRHLYFEAFDWDIGRMGNILLDDITFKPSSSDTECQFQPSEARPPQKQSTIAYTSPYMTTQALTSNRVATNATMTTQQPTDGTKESKISTNSANVSGGITRTEMSSKDITQTLFASSSSPQTLLSTSPLPNITATYIPKSFSRTMTLFQNTSSDLGTTLAVTSKQILNTSEVPSKENVEARKVTTEQMKQVDGTKTVGQDAISARPSKSQTILITFVVVGILVLLVFPLLAVCFIRHKKRRRLSYYDNCTVAMTRMTPEIVKIRKPSLEYQKLT